jgi:hypothetical protein
MAQLITNTCGSRSQKGSSSNEGSSSTQNNDEKSSKHVPLPRQLAAHQTSLNLNHADNDTGRQKVNPQ